MDLNRIQDPEFLNDLSIKELEALSKEIRAFLVNRLSETGGHLSSNMGVVELTLAMHKVFDSPKDRLLFDVGHQCYVHKILTGRASEFSTLRQLDGLSGFLKQGESPHDVFEAGHSSTSIGAAAGMLFAKEHNHAMGNVVALIGDGALASGVALESLNFLGHYTSKNPIIILNDNEMSISQNVGHLSKMLTKIRMKSSYRSLKRKTTKLIPKKLRPFTSKIESRLKGFLTGTTYFESIGFQYYGPLDGHDFKQLLKAFNTAKKSNKPTVIHVRTQKGKGYPHAEKDTTGKWHGAKPFDIETGVFHEDKVNHTRTYSKIVADHLENYAGTHPDFYVVTPAMKGGAELYDFEKSHPSQLIDTGIAESTAALVSTYLAEEGSKVFLTIYSTFLQRAYDQVVHDMARLGANVVIGVDRSGLVGGDGETHQGIYDIPMLAHVPNITIAHPENPVALKATIDYALEKHTGGPIAIRFPRKTVPTSILEETPPVVDGPSWEWVRSGSEGTIIAFGDHIESIMKQLDGTGLDVALINARFIKPLDKAVLSAIDPSKPLLIHEESILKGGLGSMIITHLAETGQLPIRVKRLGFDEAYVPQGKREALLKRYNLDAKSVVHTMKAMLDEA
ncbi:MAG: 1-deoxy-D-xylulose-5-phosphate synthase [Bacillota bacterium]